MNKLSFFICLSLFSAGCTRTDLRDVVKPESPASGNGECEIRLLVSNLPDYGQSFTRQLPQASTDKPVETSGQQGCLPGSKETLRMGYEVNTTAPTTRAYPNNGLFGANSYFRMLIFKGELGQNEVNMDSPVENVVCRVDEEGKTALFVQPTSLKLTKGDYVFICFPADDKYNLWAVGNSAASSGCNHIPIAQDEDFVCLTTGTLPIGNEAYTLQLGTFTRTGYQLTVNFLNESGYDLTAPTDQLSLTVSDDGTTNHIINTGAKVDVTNKNVADYTGHSLTVDIGINTTADAQVFTGQTFFLIADNAASRKLTIAYPELTVNGKQITADTYTTESAINFKAGRAYTFTFTLKDN